jgi:hypothetical protein
MDIKPPYTAFGTVGGQDMNMTAPEGISSIYNQLA